MSLRKFRSIEEMNAYQERQVRVETDPHKIVAQAAALFELAHRFCPGLFRGVHKFHNMEESNAFRLRWTRERARRLEPGRAVAQDDATD